MGIVELKAQLHQKIDGLDDTELLSTINDLLSSKETFIIPAYMLPDIKQGIADYANNDFMTLNEFEEKYQRWLKD